MSMSEGQLIKYVKKYPVLYDITMGQNRDAATRNAVWEEISQRLRVPAEDLKARWGKLRNCYVNAVKRRKKKSSKELPYYMPWKYEKEMEFLLPYLTTRKRNAPMVDNSLTHSTMMDSSIIDDVIMDKSMNNNNGNDSIKEETFLYYDRPQSAASSNNESISSILNDFNEPSPSRHNDSYIIQEHKSQNIRPLDEMDEHDYFFMAMSKQFKNLPRSVQSDIKFQIHKLIYEAEKRQQNSCNSLI